MVAAPRHSAPAPAVKGALPPRIAVIAPPPAVDPYPLRHTGAPATVIVVSPQVAQFYYTPAIILTDGRVFTNFGNGYEQVLRRCPYITGPLPPGFATPACWTIDSYGRYVVITQR
jgi:hypothetical protein